jgi:hypothetical protein
LYIPPQQYPDLAPCDLCLFSKVESALKGTHFQSVSEAKLKMVVLLNRVSADDLQHCFQQWKFCMQQYIDGVGGSMLKGI